MYTGAKRTATRRGKSAVGFGYKIPAVRTRRRSCGFTVSLVRTVGKEEFAGSLRKKKSQKRKKIERELRL